MEEHLWEKVYSSSSDFSANLIKNKLEVHGIHCQLLNKQDSSYSIAGGFSNTAIDIYVVVDKAEQALKIIQTETDE